MISLGSFAITLADSQQFARASGDYNPLHLDPVAARRTRFGQPLIHGICGTIKALDLLLERRSARTELLGIKVKFSKPAAPDQKLAVFYTTSDQITRIEVLAGDSRCQVIELIFAESAATTLAMDNQILPADDMGECAELNIESCRSLQGAIDLIWNQAAMAALFPSATQHIPRTQLAILLACTRIVGMRCPGLHSVFAQLDLRFRTPELDDGTCAHAALAYKVQFLDPRIDRVVLSVENPCVEGTLEAFFRPPPVQQVKFTQLTQLVTPDEFSDQNALVIGASRGLGEVIAKVLAAGGANVVMTYAAGREDALRVAREIEMTRHVPKVFAYNVLAALPDEELKEGFSTITHLYYLASPLITKSDSGQWSPQLFARYCSFYIDGLAVLLNHLAQCRENGRGLRIFVPSTVFLEENVKGFDEYIAAKAAAESFVKCFVNAHRHCSAYAPRLPRLHTDQTAGIKALNERQTLDVILAALRRTTSGSTMPTNPD